MSRLQVRCFLLRVAAAEHTVPRTLYPRDSNCAAVCASVKPVRPVIMTRLSVMRMSLSSREIGHDSIKNREARGCHAQLAIGQNLDKAVLGQKCNLFGTDRTPG